VAPRRVGRRGRGAGTAERGFEEPCERKWLPKCAARGRKGAGSGGGVEMALGTPGGASEPAPRSGEETAYAERGGE
jgi:hypothetical protein